LSIVDTLTEIDLEGLQDQMCRIMIEELNDEIAEIDAAREQADQDLYEVLGLTVTLPITCEPVVLFHPGHRPSLIQAPKEMYPNLSVMAYRDVTRQSNDDDGSWHDTTVSIETMVKAIALPEGEKFTRENQAAEELVNRRVQRTAKAIHNVSLRDRTLGGFLVGTHLGDTPNRNIGDVFVRRDKDGTGDRWLWQGARLDYSIVRFRISD
jgi:hypothetical protein